MTMIVDKCAKSWRGKLSESGNLLLDEETVFKELEQIGSESSKVDYKMQI